LALLQQFFVIRSNIRSASLYHRLLQTQLVLPQLAEFLNMESRQRQELKQNKSDWKQTLGGQRSDVAKCRFKPMERP
jgi:hypothetical protein